MLQKTASTCASIAITLEDNKVKDKFFHSKCYFEFVKQIKSMYSVMTLT